MAVYWGNLGFIAVGANTVAEVRDFSLTESSNTAPRTVQGDIYERHVVTTRNWSGSGNAYYDDTDTNGQQVLVAGASVTLNLYPIGDAAGREYFTGTATITEFSVTSNNEGLVEFSFSFQGNGTLTRGTAA